MSDWMQPYDPYDPYGFMTDSADEALAAQMMWLEQMGIDPDVDGPRDAYSAYGVQLSNEGKFLNNQRVQQQNFERGLDYMNDPRSIMLGGAFDPVTYQALVEQMTPQAPPPPFEVAGPSPTRMQWEGVSTPQGEIVRGIFDAIDQGVDPYAVVAEVVRDVGGDMKADLGNGFNGATLQKIATDYFDEQRKRSAAQAQYEYETQAMQQGGPGGLPIGEVRAMDALGMDPSLGSPLEEYVEPLPEETGLRLEELIGQRQQRDDDAYARAMARYSGGAMGDAIGGLVRRAAGFGGGDAGVHDLGDGSDLQTVKDFYNSPTGRLSKTMAQTSEAWAPGLTLLGNIFGSDDGPQRRNKDGSRDFNNGTIREVPKSSSRRSGERRRSLGRTRDGGERRPSRSGSRERVNPETMARFDPQGTRDYYTRAYDRELDRQGGKPRRTGQSVHQRNAQQRAAMMRWIGVPIG